MTYKEYLNRWPLRGPVRLAKAIIIHSHKVFFYLRPFLGTPSATFSNIQHVARAWRSNGWTLAREVVRRLPFEMDYQRLWSNQYLKSFDSNAILGVFKHMQGMSGQPLVSIFTTVDSTRKSSLPELVRSIVAQVYENWELCIAVESSALNATRKIIDDIAPNDARISTSVTNTATQPSSSIAMDLGMAHGLYTMLLDCGAVLEPQALFRIAQCIGQDGPDLIYADEAIASHNGYQLVGHNYRPAFSLEYLRAHPYIDHMLVANTEVLRKIGGIDQSLEYASRYDLTLRAVDAAKKIAHIPEALTIWRQPIQPLSHKERGQAMAESRIAIERHLERRGVIGLVEDGSSFNTFDVQYPLREALKVAIIIPTKNCGDLVRQCIDSIAQTVRHVAYDIVVIDHASDDPESITYFAQLSTSHTLLRYAGPFNFSAINNWAVAQLEGDYSHYLFCNNDIEAIHDGWLERMMGLGQMHDVGMVGAKLLYPDRKSIQHAGVCVGMYGIAEHYGKFADAVAEDGSPAPGYHAALITNHEMSAVTAACALIRKDVFDFVGGYDEDLAVGFGDVDLCLRVREAGYRILYCAQAELVHHESYTRGKAKEDPHPADSAKFVQKWRATLAQCDPYYNPNLTIQSTHWGVKQPMVFQLDIANRIWCAPQTTQGSSAN